MTRLVGSSPKRILEGRRIAVTLTLLLCSSYQGDAGQGQAPAGEKTSPAAPQNEGATDKSGRDASQAEAKKAAWLVHAKKVRDHFERDVQAVPDMKLRSFFDVPEVPRPYLLLMEDVPLPAAEASTAIYGPALAALRTAFRREYGGKKILPNAADETRVLPVVVFGSRKSYDRYRKHGHTWLPHGRGCR